MSMEIVLPVVTRQKWSWKRFFRRFTWSFVIFIVGSLLLFDGCVQFRDTNQEVYQYFKQKKTPVKINFYQAQARRIRYLEVGNNDSLPTLLFIHGAPSSSSYFKSYLTNPEFLKRFKMYAVDRPGYGYSGFGDPFPSIEGQAKAIKVIIDSLHKVHRPTILVAASYGTSIACRIAMEVPELIDGLVLLAPSLEAGQETTYWVSYPFSWDILSWLTPRMLHSANMEKLSHGMHLKEMEPYWHKLNMPVIYLQGDQDKLILPSNAQFAKKKMVNVPYLEIAFYKGRGHLIAFAEQGTINESVLKMLEITTKPLPKEKVRIERTIN